MTSKEELEEMQNKLLESLIINRPSKFDRIIEIFELFLGIIVILVIIIFVIIFIWFIIVLLSSAISFGCHLFT